jgi:uncharacterized protein (DUF2336 family)
VQQELAPVIIQTFVRWADTAKATDRAKAANALGRAFLQSEMDQQERQAALMALTWLLDDPSPKVRLALAEALADSEMTPRSLILPLSADQPEIACHIIARSPVLTDIDLVDLAASGDDVVRVLIASRFIVSQPVCAALAEIGGEIETAAMLGNPGAIIGRQSLRRISERHAASAEIRELLLSREELPADARHLLALGISEALSECGLVRHAIGERRFDRIRREACEAATVSLASEATPTDIPALIEHLRRDGRLTPNFLMQALCAGKVDFFAAAMVNLSGLAEKRVRSILADGRFHAMRALYEAAGLNRDVSEIFVEATLQWRKASRGDETGLLGTIAGRIVGKFRAAPTTGNVADELIDMIEKLQFAEQRQSARAFATFLAA